MAQQMDLEDAYEAGIRDAHRQHAQLERLVERLVVELTVLLGYPDPVDGQTGTCWFCGSFDRPANYRGAPGLRHYMGCPWGELQDLLVWREPS